MYFDLKLNTAELFITSILLTILLHDTYCWTYPGCTDRAFLKWMHRIHHQSKNPSPWVVLCLQPMGGFGSGRDFPHLTAALMPIHPLAFGASAELAATQQHPWACRL